MTAPALSEFEAKVQQIMAAFPGVPRDKAEASVTLNFPELARKPELLEPHALNLREKEEQAYVAKLFRGFGCTVWSLSQARATKQTPGIPDLFVTHRAAKLAFWFETKRQSGGRIRPEQLEFQEACHAAGVRAYIGDRRTAAKLLVDVGLAKVGEGPCGIVPFHEGR